jgi:hypothetical protein
MRRLNPDPDRAELVRQLSRISEEQGEVLRRLDEPYYRKQQSPKTKPPEQQEQQLEGGIVRGRWCITALPDVTALPSDISSWDAEFEKTSNKRYFGASPTCFGELPSSFWYRYATRFVLTVRASEATSVQYAFGVSGLGSGKKAVLKVNGVVKEITSDKFETALEIRSGSNRIVVMTSPGVEIYGFGQFLHGPVVFYDLGCGNISVPGQRTFGNIEGVSGGP